MLGWGFYHLDSSVSYTSKAVEFLGLGELSRGGGIWCGRNGIGMDETASLFLPLDNNVNSQEALRGRYF